MRATSTVLLAAILLLAGTAEAQKDGKKDKAIKTIEDVVKEEDTPTMAEKSTKTCASVEECGEVVDPPYYYDWTYKPSSMYTLTKIFFIQSNLMGFLYGGEIFA